MARDSVMIETDAVDASSDTSSATAQWWNLAQQMKQDLTTIILMSEADLQVTLIILLFYSMAGRGYGSMS